MGDANIAKVRKYPFLPLDPQQGWLPYASLLYPIQFLVGQAVHHTPAREWLSALLGIAIFVPLYFRHFWERSARRLLLALAMVLLGFVYAQSNVGAAAFRRLRRGGRIRAGQ
jgi:hypothetical protein